MRDHRAPAQARVLSIIASSQTPPSMVELAGRSVSGPRPLTPQVDAMRQAELVSHRIDPHNRHSRCRISLITASSLKSLRA
jgi:DNA-binding MarR family transcriptional regulator